MYLIFLDSLSYLGASSMQRRPTATHFLQKMKQTITTSSFWYEERGHSKAGTRAGGGRPGDDKDGASTVSDEEEDGGDKQRQHVCSAI